LERRCVGETSPRSTGDPLASKRSVNEVISGFQLDMVEKI
jgi:hypothetical protein